MISSTKLICTFAVGGIVSNVCQAFTIPQPKISSSSMTTTSLMMADNLFFASTSTPAATTDIDESTSTTNIIDADVQSQQQRSNTQKTQSRTLGSQELLMLPRQYQPKLDANEPYFPSMSHVSVTKLSCTPSINALSKAIDIAIDTHPLLRSHVQGDGEPDERIDLFQMVRKGEPNPCTFVAPSTKTFDSKDVLNVVDVSGDLSELEKSWQTNFNTCIDDGSWYENASVGPLWKLTLHRLQQDTGDDDSSSSSDSPCALVFWSNHAISDQGSVNLLMDQLLADIVSIEDSQQVSNKPTIQDMPMAMEDSVLGLNNRWSDVTTDGIEVGTIKYVADKAAEGFKSPVILPDDANNGGDSILGAVTTIMGKSAGGEDSESSSKRSTTLQFRTLSSETTTALLEACRANGVSITNALIAAMALTSTDFIDGGEKKKDKERNYKVLQSLDMRRFGAKRDKCDTVACMAGSNDLMLGPLPDHSGESIREGSTSSQDLFWKLAKEGRDQTNDFINSNGPQHAVRVFDFAMTISDMNNLVDLTAKSKDSQGRAYSAGVTNNGVYERQKSVKRENGNGERHNIQVKHGKYQVEDVFFGTPHARSGCLYQLSALSVDGSMKLTFHPASPIVSEETNNKFANAFVDLLEKVVSGEDDTTKAVSSEGFLSQIPEGSLSIVAAALGFIGVAIHAGAWSEFFSNLAIMKDNVENPQDFWDAVNFWIFFAVGHPILQPILWISDVLHGSPGPLVFDLVPATFLLANLVFIGATAYSKEFRGALNVAALSAFLTYVGAGLDGQAGLGDLNLQLNDKYHGQVVKGCPTYEDVRQPSMNGFDLEKYQGKWYEQKFHDWTQFKEVYDTTLDIKLTSDKKVSITTVLDST